MTTFSMTFMMCKQTKKTERKSCQVNELQINFTNFVNAHFDATLLTTGKRLFYLPSNNNNAKELANYMI